MKNHRFSNWKTYIFRENILEKKHDTIVLLVTFNQLYNIKKLAEFLVKQKNVDVLIVNNRSNDGTFEFLLENYKDKFNIIQTTKNLGGAGGYALGQEWIIKRGYEYCIITEDDAIPLDKDIIEEMIKRRSPNSEVLAKYYELNQSSFTFHFHLYPVWFFKKVGVVNWRYFMRADDWEFGSRINKFIRVQKNFKTIVVNKYYSHPLAKKGFGMLPRYFGLRNWLIVTSQYPRKNLVFDFFLVLLEYFWNSFFILFFDHRTEGILQVKDALIDVLRKDFSRNELMLEKYKNFKLEPKNYHLQELSLQEFIEKFKKYRMIGKLSRSVMQGKFGKSLSHFVTRKYNSPTRILAFFGKKIVFIEELDFVDEKVLFFEYNNNRFFTIPLVLLSGLIATIFSLVFLPILLIRLKLL